MKMDNELKGIIRTENVKYIDGFDNTNPLKGVDDL